MDIKSLEMTLNLCLNKAMCRKGRIQNPSSNNIAEFVTNFLNEEKLSGSQKLEPCTTNDHIQVVNTRAYTFTYHITCAENLTETIHAENPQAAVEIFNTTHDLRCVIDNIDEL